MKFITTEIGLLDLLNKAVSTKIEKYSVTIKLDDDSEVEFSASHEDGEIFIVYKPFK